MIELEHSETRSDQLNLTQFRLSRLAARRLKINVKTPNGAKLGRGNVLAAPKRLRRLALLRPLDRLPNPQRRRRHIDRLDAQRPQRVDDGRRRADGAAPADTFEPLLDHVVGAAEERGR
jgi:hypothetical protein